LKAYLGAALPRCERLPEIYSALSPPPEGQPASDTGLMHRTGESGRHHAGANRTVMSDNFQ
jgi:hypothetical protein